MDYIMMLFHWITHKKTSYYQITGNSYLSTLYDAGKYGEYLIYRKLKRYEKNGCRFLFNTYLPKENEETTEIDVLMISAHGIFVFESKNYSGWIFGKENQASWTQTLPKGRRKSHKEHFYNPIWQNASHVKHLRALIGEDIPVYSVIVFSERCTLKNVEMKSGDIHVINRYDLPSIVSSICSQPCENSLSEDEIEKIYGTLFPFSQADEATKQQHIKKISLNIQRKRQVMCGIPD